MNMDIYSRFVELEDKVKLLQKKVARLEKERFTSKYSEPVSATSAPNSYPHWNQVYYGYRTGI